MKELMESQEIRELDILSLLYEEEKWWSVQEIANKLNFSVHTIYRSITHINEIATAHHIDLSIISQKTRGMFLMTYSHYAINLYISVSIQQSLGYKILDRVFQSHDLTINRLADDFFVSKSTIYRKLRVIEDLFQLKGLRFDSSTFEISGPENILREFFYMMYWSVVTTESWPFRDISKQVLEHRIIEAQTNLSEIEALQLLYRLAVNFVRQKKKRYITSFSGQAFIDPIRSQAFHFVKQFNLDSIPKSYRDNENDYLLLSFMSQSHALSFNVNVKHVNDWHRNELSLPYLVSSEIINELAIVYPGERGLTKEELLYQLISTTSYGLIFSPLQLANLLDSSTTSHYGKTPIFHQNLRLIMTRLTHSTMLQQCAFDFDFMFYKVYFILRRYLDFDELEQTIQVKITCTTDPLLEELLKAKLTKMTAFPLTINTSLDQRTEHHSEFDLVISDCLSHKLTSSQKTSQYTYAVPPTERDWQNIVTLLNKINKEQTD